ncbi:3-hydroxyacyl-CoA dehydrogenase @ 17hydroxysteroid dehydrogenase type 10 (HSD10)-like [hydrothermal vent metagenome]|uniref:3-hydroxyacyl-CoA dehydrogenase @ 17hydroxysteroid dehydrogenase type 10 (HSD10)-like n=1 Tax=hydrothermal vent metagenome TaxID=652676 RepID=A0A3B0ZXV7_9ZZZZ
MKWKNVKAIVTGGASGLGLAVVERILKADAQVAIIDLKAALENSKLNIKSQIAFKTEKLLALNADVTNDESMTAAIDSISKKFDGINVVINCAGILFSEKMLSMDHTMLSSDFEKVLAVNLMGTFRVCRIAADSIRHYDEKNKSQSEECGVIINTASIAAFEGQIGQLAYSASKGGIVSMTLPMARELARHKIRVMTIAPGLFDTSMLQGLSDEVKQNLIDGTVHPHRLGVATEFSKMVQHIVENPMLNGSTIRLDGAIRLAVK